MADFFAASRHPGQPTQQGNNRQSGICSAASGGKSDGNAVSSVKIDPQISPPWFRRETATFAFKVAAVAGLLLTVGVQDDLLNLNFSFRLFVKILLSVFVLYSVASFSYARAYMESTAATHQAKRSGRPRLE